MEKTYDHKKYEEKIYKMWEKSGAFKPAPITTHHPPFTILMPPPNANDPLHIGHAMFVAIEDILIRFHRMLGDSTVWLPGTDHAGIETQFVFEKKLAKKGKSRFDFDRKTLYKMIWDYVQENSGVAVDQMKKLGASADWSRYKFTLDKDVVNFVQETFIKLYKDKLIYKGEKLVNYCTHCGTGYSELEVEYEEKQSPLYYVRYYYADNQDKFITVATTRPEPIFADTHLAINPKNKKTKHLKGNKLLNPLTGDEMEIIEDGFVDPNFGTGIVKLTPAHDHSDFEVAQKFNLPMNKAINNQGKMTGGPSNGKKVSVAREETAELLQKTGHLERIDKNYVNRVATCYRCHRVLEILPMTQFFINTKPLAKKALKALDKKETTIMGAGQEKILRHWLENIKDWNISRQIVWGIQIPVWYDVSKNKNIQVTFINKKGNKKTGKISEFNLEEVKKGLQTITVPDNTNFVVSIDKPKGKYLPETDTFDTWFSSGQWTVVTLKTGKPHDFEKFYPTSVMETGYDILPIWVMRMMLLSIYLDEKHRSPFKKVYLHGLVRDEKGRKMSKSIGNVINPLEIVEKYGSDALRFALVMSSTPAQDKNVGENTFRGMRNFSNKIWNAARFVKDFKEEGETNPAYECFMATVIHETTKHFNDLRIGQAAEYLYNEFWHNFCDKWIEESKKGSVRATDLKNGFKDFLKLLHPFMPFVTEAVWKELRDEGDKNLLITSPWPKS